MGAWSESDRLHRTFSQAAGGRFSIIYRALCAAAKDAGSANLTEQAVLDHICNLIGETNERRSGRSARVAAPPPLANPTVDKDAQAMSEWQPIETAPRDGTEFLAYAASVGKFDVCRWTENSIHQFERGKQGCYETVQHDGMYGPEDDEFGYWDATHWVPLPSPPVVHIEGLDR